MTRLTPETHEPGRERPSRGRGNKGNDPTARRAGTVYLLHFEQQLGRCRHYLGYTTDLQQRLEDHRLGRGGKTTARFRAAGISFELAAQWPGSPEDERRLKSKNLALPCGICRGKKMTVLEALQQAADPATRKATMSLTDLAKVTKASRSRVRTEIQDLLDDGKITIINKGDAGQNKTAYQLAQCVPVRPAVRENYAQHSFAQPNRIVEQDTTRFADSIELDTVPAHSAAHTTSGSSTGDGGLSEHGKIGAGSSQVLSPALSDPNTAALPPLLAYFKDVRDLGCCLDSTSHYIVHVQSVMNVLRYPTWAREAYYSGILSVFHIPYSDSRLRDVFHAVVYFREGLRHDEASSCTCPDHRLMRLVHAGFPDAIEIKAQVRNCHHEYVEALYDIRRYCPECAGLQVLPARFPGFDYIPYELTERRMANSHQQDDGAI